RAGGLAHIEKRMEGPNRALCREAAVGRSARSASANPLPPCPSQWDGQSLDGTFFLQQMGGYPCQSFQLQFGRPYSNEHGSLRQGLRAEKLSIPLTEARVTSRRNSPRTGERRSPRGPRSEHKVPAMIKHAANRRRRMSNLVGPCCIHGEQMETRSMHSALITHAGGEAISCVERHRGKTSKHKRYAVNSWWIHRRKNVLNVSLLVRQPWAIVSRLRECQEALGDLQCDGT
ncbi:hypothetical protein KUCAC02_016917, partial [Chaenocephalus aceratus]